MFYFLFAASGDLVVGTGVETSRSHERAAFPGAAGAGGGRHDAQKRSGRRVRSDGDDDGHDGTAVVLLSRSSCGIVAGQARANELVPGQR